MNRRRNAVNFEKRASRIVMAVCVASIVLVYYLLGTFGLVKGTAKEADSYITEMKAVDHYEKTLEGVFTDRNGDPVTVAQEAGKAATVCDPSYSYLIGLNSFTRGMTGLTARYKDILYDTAGDGKHGKSIQLTTDNGLQNLCHTLLQENDEPVEGAIVVIENKSGKIRAMTSRVPSEVEFDPNRCDDEACYDAWMKTNGLLMDRALISDDPVGSTGKMLTACSMFENTIDDFVLEDTGNVEGIHNYDFGAMGRLELADAFTKSSNTYFASAGLKLGYKKLSTTLNGFLIGEEAVETDFGILDGRYDNGSYTRHDLATIAYGQGIYLSPVQLCVVLQTILNDGKMLCPSIVEQIDDKPVSESKILAKPISKKTARAVKGLMTSAAESYGAADRSYMAKTGTADTHRGTNHIWIAGGDDRFSVVISHNNSGSTSGSLMSDLNAILAYANTNL